MGRNVFGALRHAIVIVLGVGTLVGFDAALAQTPSQVVYGPASVKLPNSSLFTFSNSFSAPASVTGPYLLRVQLSAPNSLTSFSFKLNNVQVLSLSDFAGGKTLVDRTVTVQTNNTYSIQVAGKTNTVITVTVFATPNLPKPTSLTPNPLTVTVGANGVLTATLSPTPTAAGTLNVSSANTVAATVPASVNFASGQTSVAIPVTTHAVGSAIITASANGGSASATVNVTPAPPTVTSLAPPSLAVTQGASGNLTVTISAAQTATTQVLLATSNTNIASVASSVSVPAGQVSAPVPVPGASPGTAQITASLNGSSASSQITVSPAAPTVVSLVPATSTVTLGASTTLALAISAAQSTNTVVSLSATPAGIVSIAAQVTVLAGQTTAPVSVGTVALGQAGITASLNGTTASAIVNVVAPPVAVSALEPASFTMNVGATSSFTVRINAAQSTNTPIALAVDNPSVLQIPASVTVAQGQMSAVFTATGLAAGNAIITASANGTSKTSSVHVSPQAAAIVSLLPNPLPLQEGATGSLTVTVNVAQEADTVITLANDAVAVVHVAASVTIAAGAITALIPVNALSSGAASVTASVNGTSAATLVQVTPPPPVVTSITPATLTLPKGTPGTLRVTVSRAPNVATTVTLSSSDQTIASVPPSVNIPQGALSAEFPVASNAVGQVTIAASLNGGSAISTVTVTAAELTTLTLSPQTPTIYTGEPLQFTATGTMTDGTSQDFSTRVTWTSSGTTVATINASGLVSALAGGTSTIGASFTFATVINGQNVTVSTSTALTVKQPVALVLTAPTTTLQAGSSTTVTVTSSDPAPAGGLVVTLAATGTGSATYPAAVQIAAGGTSTTFTLTANTGGTLQLTATAPERLPGSITFTIRQIAIISFTPTAAPVGTAVAINGIGFDPVTSNNQVRFNGELAIVASGNATLLNAIVPTRATTGFITVTNALGAAASPTPFTVQDREAFDIALAPEAIQVPLGGNGATRVTLVNIGLNTYPYAALVSVSGLPPGITAGFDRPSVFMGGNVVATFSAQASAAAGAYPITLTAIGQTGVTTSTRSKTLQLQVLAAGSTTVTGRVLHADDASPFVGARVRLAGAQAFTNETGTYRFVGPPVLGDQVLLVDGNSANTPTSEFPSGIPMPVMIVAGQDNKVLTSFIQKVDPTKFTNIVPGAAATVTNPEIPNYSLNIPQGATLFGWDGQPIDKISVRTVSIDRLPIKPIPDGLNTRSVYLYYFFREGGANPTQPIPVTMANDVGALPGEKVDLWYYDESPTPDPNSNQWRMMGLGTITPDGKSAVSDPGVGIPKFCCGASFLARRTSGVDTGANEGDGDGPNTCSPVNLPSGNALVFRPRRFSISKLLEVDLNCRYRSTDTRVGLFGRGMSSTYDWFAEPVGSAVQVTNPQGVRFILSLEADGVYRSQTGRSAAIGMKLIPTPTGRMLTLADGTQYEFDGRGRLLAVTDLAGNRTTLQLDGDGFPLSLTDPVGKIYRLDRQGAAPAITITRITDPVGRFIEFAYDEQLRMTSYTDQGGGATFFEYDASGRLSKKTDPRAAVEQIEYDAAGRATKEILPEGGIQQFAYNVAGTAVTETRHTDENGNTTTYRWNGLGYVTQITDALGQLTRLDRDPATNLVRSRTDSAGRVTQYSYNQRGDVIKVLDPDNNQTLIDYDLRFRKPIRIENALGNVTTIEYDPNGNLTSITNAELEATTFTYTEKGQLATATDPLNRLTHFSYDASGNLLEAINTAGETSTGVYDATNRLIEAIDPLGRRTILTYDMLDRVTLVRDAAQGFTLYAYDANDNLLSTIDPRNNPVERNVYDLRNRLTQKTDAKNLSMSYAYDGVGNLLRITDRKSQPTQYQYDALNRLTQIQDADGRTTTYGYDLAGNLTRISDTQSGDILMSYDRLDRVIEIVTAQGTLGYAYDAVGRRTSLTISGGDVTNYGYDKVNRIKSVTLRGRSATYGYDAMGRLAQKILPDGIKVAYQYDTADRVTSMAYSKADDTPIETVTYAYNSMGQRIFKGTGTPGVQDSTIAASYDEANRLTQIILSGETFTLGYDANGNLTSKSGPTSGTTTYTWDARNRLTQIAGPNGTASFRYDALGRRIERNVGVATTGYLYDGAQAIAELKGNAIDTLYHAGLQIDEVVARYGSTGNKTLLTDALMSVIAQASDEQTIQNLYTYSPYGEVQALGSDEGNPLQYTGRENDNTGLYYYRARYYDAVLKRFVSEDPLGIDGGLNYYRYVYGNPVSATDPTGEFSLVSAVTAVAIVGIALASVYYMHNLGQDSKEGLEAAKRQADLRNECVSSGGRSSACNQMDVKQPLDNANRALEDAKRLKDALEAPSKVNRLNDLWKKIKAFCQ